MADLQRNLKDSEQRSTLWARRAGAAEARAPVQATSARSAQRPFPTNPSPPGADWEGLIGISAGTVGRPDDAVGSLRKRFGSVERQQGRSLARQQEEPAQAHEDGCAQLLLQEAWSAAPDGRFEMVQSIHSTRQDSMDQGMSLIRDATMPSGPQREFKDCDQVLSLKQRIAEYQKQNGLSALPRLHASEARSGELQACQDGLDSPLKERVAEYDELLEQHFSSSAFRTSPPSFAGRFESLDRLGIDANQL